MSETYLIQPDLVSAQNRSAQQAVALGCDGVFTRYWWPVQPLTDGTAAIVIQPDTPFDVAASTRNRPSVGLTAQEQAALKTSAQVQSLLSAKVSEK